MEILIKTVRESGLIRYL